MIKLILSKFNERDKESKKEIDRDAKLSESAKAFERIKGMCVRIYNRSDVQELYTELTVQDPPSGID